jgi:phage-related protein
MKSLIDGLVEAVTGSGSRVGAAFQRLAQQGIDSFRSALGISSPSRVFAEFGRNITQGTEKGIESGKPDVQNATANLVDAPEGAGAGGTTSISIGEVIVQAGESSNPRELAVMFRDELASVLEGVGVEVGVSS